MEMKHIKFLKLDDLYKCYTSKGQLRKGIKKIHFSYPHPVIIKEDKKEFILKLNWKYNFGITKLIGVYREPETYGEYTVYFR